MLSANIICAQCLSMQWHWKSVSDLAFVSQAIYGSGGAAPGADAAGGAGGAGGADAGPKGGDDNVVDAEFTDTDK